MARTAATSNGVTETMTKNFQSHAERIRKDIATLADSVSEAGTSLAKDAKAGADAKASDLKQTSDETIRELRAQLETIEARVGNQVRERPITALAAAAGVGFLIALLARR